MKRGERGLEKRRQKRDNRGLREIEKRETGREEKEKEKERESEERERERGRRDIFYE